MNNMPLKLRDELASDPSYSVCARWYEDAYHCGGRVTFEHAIIYAGKQVQEKWAIIPLCVNHHLGPHLDKPWNKQYAMSRATEEDRKKYPRLKWS